jgi:hypothetical protein
MRVLGSLASAPLSRTWPRMWPAAFCDRARPRCAPITAEDGGGHFLRQAATGRPRRTRNPIPWRSVWRRSASPGAKPGQREGAGVDLANVAAGGEIAARRGLKLGDVGCAKAGAAKAPACRRGLRHATRMGRRSGRASRPASGQVTCRTSLPSLRRDTGSRPRHRAQVRFSNVENCGMARASET